MKSIVEEIKARRKELRMTQMQMSELLGMAQAQYQKIEANGNPSLKTLNSILKVLDLELMVIPREKSGEILKILYPKNAVTQSFSLLEKYGVKESE